MCGTPPLPRDKANTQQNHPEVDGCKQSSGQEEDDQTHTGTREPRETQEGFENERFEWRAPTDEALAWLLVDRHGHGRTKAPPAAQTSQPAHA